MNARDAKPWLLVPVRSLSTGKRRLGTRLDPAGRRQLNEGFLRHLLGQASAFPGLDHTLVVSPCADVLDMVRDAGARALRQPDWPLLDEASCQPLNAALVFARGILREWAAQDLLVVSSDLPFMHSTELRELVAIGWGSQRRVVVATDRAGRGTNALYLPAGAQFSFCFGIDSAMRHAEAAKAIDLPMTQVNIPGLAFDIDTPADLDEMARTSVTSPRPDAEIISG